MLRMARGLRLPLVALALSYLVSPSDASTHGAVQSPPVLGLSGGRVDRPWIEVTPITANAPAKVFTPEESAGSVVLAGIQPGLALVCAGGEKTAVRCAELIIAPGVEASFARAAAGVRATGTISIGRAPAAGATVAVVLHPFAARRPFTLPLKREKAGGLLRQIRCDRRGRFTLPLLAPGTYRLEVRTTEGRADHGRPFTIPQPAALRKAGGDPSRPPLYDLGAWALDEGVAVEVSVFDRLGAPIAGASVGGMQRTRGGELLDFEAHTGTDGLARLARVDPALSLHLSCLAPGFVTLQKDLAGAPGNARCDLDRVAAISGNVLDDADRPLSGASITLRRTGRETTTGEGGAFAIEGVEPGEYWLVAAKTGFRAVEREVSLMAGERKTLAPVRLPPGDELAGKVIDDESSSPIPGAAVEVTEPPGGGAATTDSDGRFVLTVGSDLSLALRITADGYPAKVVAVSETEPERGEPVVVRLSRGGRIQASVWSEELEAPCVGCNLTLTSGSGELASLMTGMDGEVLSSPLAPGTWQVALLQVESLGSVVTVRGGESIRAATVRAGQTTPVVFGPRPALAVSFSSPLPAGWSLLARAGASASVAREQPDGSYAVRRRPGEALTLSLTGPGLEEVRQVVIPADFAEPAITLPLYSTGVSGVLRRGERPLARAELVLIAASGGSTAAAVRTGEGGAFSIPYLPPGLFTVVADGQPVRTVEVGDDAVDLGSIPVPSP